MQTAPHEAPASPDEPEPPSTDDAVHFNRGAAVGNDDDYLAAAVVQLELDAPGLAPAFRTLAARESSEADYRPWKVRVEEIHPGAVAGREIRDEEYLVVLRVRREAP